MIPAAQLCALRAALAAPELRIPYYAVRRNSTRQALTGAFWNGNGYSHSECAWMREEFDEVDSLTYLRLLRAGAAALGPAALADFDARNLDPTDEIVASYGPDGRWDSDSARQVFATAYHQARFRGLSAAAAEAVLRNVVAAVEHELTFRQNRT